MPESPATLLDKLKQAPPNERLKGLTQLCDEPSFWGHTHEAARLDEAAALGKTSNKCLPEISILRAKYHLRRGELALASQSVSDAISFATDLHNSSALIAATIEYARLQLRKADYNDALETTEKLLLELTADDAVFKVDVLAIKSNAFEGLGKNKEALNTGLEALALSRKINYAQGEASVLSVLGYVYDEMGAYDLALQHQVQAREIWQQLGNRFGIAATLNQSGNVYWEQSNYPEALKNHMASLKIKDELGDVLGMGSSYNNIANIYNNLASYDEALKYYALALQFFERIGYKVGESAANFGIGVVYHEKGMHSDALTYHLRALDIRKLMASEHAIAQSYNYVGNIYAALGNFELALQYQLQGLEIVTKQGGLRYIGNSLSGIGRSYLGLGKYQEAKPYLVKALETGREIGEKLIIRESLFALIKLHRATKDFEQAVDYYELYDQVNNEITGSHTQVELGKLNHQYGLERKEKELEYEHLRNVELKRERDRSESLLLNILPAEVSKELKEKGKAEARLFDPVTILFTDFIGFTKVSELLTPQQLVDELHTCFSAFDEIISKYNIEKIKTMGDGFIAAAGLPTPNARHAEDIINAALEIRDFMAARKHQLALEAFPVGDDMAGAQTFEIRIGIHSGPVVAGIVGVKKFAYDIWGDTVNTAARMEQNSEAGKINISQTTYNLVKDKFTCEYRGEISAKNKGMLKMYFVGS